MGICWGIVSALIGFGCSRRRTYEPKIALSRSRQANPKTIMEPCFVSKRMSQQAALGRTPQQSATPFSFNHYAKRNTPPYLSIPHQLYKCRAPDTRNTSAPPKTHQARLTCSLGPELSLGSRTRKTLTGAR